MTLLDDLLHRLVLLERFLIGVLLPRLCEEHDPQLVVPLDPLQPILSGLQFVGVPPTPDKICGIGVVVLVSAYKVLVDLLRLA